MKRWRPKAERNTYAQRERFGDYMVWCKSLPCAARDLDGHACNGVTEADHAGERGMGRKCSDFEVIPLCKLAHDERPGRRGAFATMDRPTMREWITATIARVQELAIARRAPDHVALLEFLGRPMPAATVTTDPDVDLPF